MSARFPHETYGDDGRGDRAANLRWAGYFLVAVGVVHAVQGVIALVDDTFATKRTTYLDLFDVTAWGWVHLALGVLAIATGVAMVLRKAWAKPVAIAMAALSILAGFAYLPFDLIGSVLAMVAACLVIGAVVAPGVFERDD
jgi:hypothetical protein